MKEKWNERYSESGYAYGEEPNNFFKQQLANLSTGKILLPAEGEGRNAVHAAKMGWEVSAFDMSEEGFKKAKQLAANHQVDIHYQVGELKDLPYQSQAFDAMALIFAHFPAEQKSAIHAGLVELLRPGAVVIFEAFSKKHLSYVNANPLVGGPKDIDMLFSVEDIQYDFSQFDIIELIEKEIELHEGEYHNGMGHVIQFIGRKR